MKKILSILLCLFTVFMLFQTVSYATDNTLKITLNAKQENLYLVVECNVEQNSGFAYLKLLPTSNSKNIEIYDIQNGKVSVDGFTVGDGGIVWDNANNVSKTGCLFTFKVSNTNDINDITVKCAGCYNIDENDVKVSIVTLKNDGMPGDVNGDDKVNTKDARAILKYVAKLEQFTAEQEKTADVNNDKKVNTKDARKILRVVAKLETM